ncbi:MAG: DUF2961 domain-containing protein [Planctomycetes bacterium]|nr:DUF2961 domain-containing protein [Planctomycetota bacterium]
MTLSIAWWGERAFAPPPRLEPSSIERRIEVAPGERVEFARACGSGAVRRLWFHADGWPWNPEDVPCGASFRTLLDLVLRIRWDGEDRPSVIAPLGAFFANGHGVRRHYASEYLVSSSTGFHSYFPMPYRNGFRMEIENVAESGATRTLACEVSYQPSCGLPGGLGRFQATHRAGASSGSDGVPVLEANGPGHFVGMTLALEGEPSSRGAFLAAREALSIVRDGLCPPQEIRDYFEGCEGRNGEFAGPLRGVPFKEREGPWLGMYRFHPEDRIRFEGAARFDYHRRRCDAPLPLPFRYSSVAFWYRAADPRRA